MSGKSGQGRWITSGDKVVDWIFSRIIHSLNYEIEAIYLKPVLRVKHRRKTANLYGYIDDDVICLSAAKTKHKDRRAIAKTLLHEAMHYVFCGIRETDFDIKVVCPETYGENFRCCLKIL